MPDLQQVVLLAPILLYSITIHEFFHAWSAWKLGDDTALRLGRVSFNPLVHLDFMGTVCFIFVGFGWGKPVPVQRANLHNPRRDNMLVSLAGPMSNLASALAFALVHRAGQAAWPDPAAGSFEANFLLFFRAATFVSLLLCVFNLIPLPPLDGGHVLEAILPRHAAEWLERNRMVLQIALLVFIFTLGAGFLHGIVAPVANLMLG